MHLPCHLKREAAYEREKYSEEKLTTFGETYMITLHGHNKIFDQQRTTKKSGQCSELSFKNI